MSVLVKGMTMPEGCNTCPFLMYEDEIEDDFGGYYCAITSTCEYTDIRFKESIRCDEDFKFPNCPLVELTIRK